jgi:hypothetical protein
MKKRYRNGNPFSLRAMLLRQGLGRTLEYLCIISAFSVD